MTTQMNQNSIQNKSGNVDKKKILFCASTVSHIVNFHIPYIKEFHENGYKVHVAVNSEVPIEYADKVIRIPFYKKFLSIKNLCNIEKLRKLIKTEEYDKISSNTTLAGIIVRLSVIFLKKRPKIYHIVHGYHFSTNSGFEKYIYLIPEKIAALVSDSVLVMNMEDYELAIKYKLYKDEVHLVDGIGISEKRFYLSDKEDRAEIRNAMGIAVNDVVFVYAAEFSKRKNQGLLIKAFAECLFCNGLLLLAGDGCELDYCKRLAMKHKIEDKIKFVGFVEDIPRLYAASDIVVSTSLSEGLPFNILEAMGCGLPVIASNIKGHRELVKDNVNGLLFESNNKDQLVRCLKQLFYTEKRQLQSMGMEGRKNVKKYTLQTVLPQIMKYYSD